MHRLVQGTILVLLLRPLDGQITFPFGGGGFGGGGGSPFNPFAQMMQGMPHKQHKPMPSQIHAGNPFFGAGGGGMQMSAGFSFGSGGFAPIMMDSMAGGSMLMGPGGPKEGPQGGNGSEGEMPFAPMGMMLGGPIIMEGHFGGFDPFEDLHKSLAQKIVDKANNSDGRELAMADGPGFEMELGNIFNMFAGDHGGHVGRSEGSFEVDDDHKTRIQITANLPGYKLEEEAESPLQVKVLGKRSVVVSGSQSIGPMTRSWQRTFNMPKGAKLQDISVEYLEKSGNLTVTVPRGDPALFGNSTDAEDEEDLDMEGLPPALKAIQAALPGLVMGADKANSHGRRGPSFLRPRQVVNPLEMILSDIFGAHPRNHAPHSLPVPEDAEIEYVGCYDETQLAKAERKYYGEQNAASFASMYWHTMADQVPYFAMARHDEPYGLAYTLRKFSHDDEKPKYGTSAQQCGARCDDDDDRWCGCANEPNRGFPSEVCKDQKDRHFAVYRVKDLNRGDNEKPPQDEDISTEAEGASEASTEKADVKQTEVMAEVKKVAKDSVIRPSWQLVPEGSGKQAIEIKVPKGTVPEKKGNNILFFNQSAPARKLGSSQQTGTQAHDHELTTAEPDKASTSQGEGLADEASQPLGAPPSGEAPVGKVKLPPGVDPNSCHWVKDSEDGSRVVKCDVQEDAVQNVKIKVNHEL